MSYVVIDTNVLVSGLWSGSLEGKSTRLLDLCFGGFHSAVYTRAIFDEYAAVLSRPKFNFPERDIDMLLDFFRFKALDVDPLFDSLSRPRCADGDDQKFYDAAYCCNALLVTGNKKHFPRDQRVLTPAEFFEGRTEPRKQ